MSETVMPEAGAVEAVIISGPRRGEIIRLNGPSDEIWSEQEHALVSTALRELDTALAGLVEAAKRVELQIQHGIERA